MQVLKEEQPSGRETKWGTKRSKRTEEAFFVIGKVLEQTARRDVPDSNDIVNYYTAASVDKMTSRVLEVVPKIQRYEGYQRYTYRALESKLNSAIPRNPIASRNELLKEPLLTLKQSMLITIHKFVFKSGAIRGDTARGATTPSKGVT